MRRQWRSESCNRSRNAISDFGCRFLQPHVAQRLDHRFGFILGRLAVLDRMDGLEHVRDRTQVLAWHHRGDIAVEMHRAALPIAPRGKTQQQTPPVPTGIGDNEPHAAEIM